jgi:hypothetical protein
MNLKHLTWGVFYDSTNEWRGLDLKLGSTDLLFKGKKEGSRQARSCFSK